MLLLAVHFPSINDVLFYVLAALTASSALVVVASRDIVRSAVGLLFSLTSVSGLYLLLNTEFLAAAQLIVYLGGTLVLIIFGVMLTGRSVLTRYEPRKSEVIFGILTAAVLFATLTVAIVAGSLGRQGSAMPESADSYSVTRLGEALMGDYLAPFELASVVLLVVMIGAAYLAKRRPAPEPRPQAAESK